MMTELDKILSEMDVYLFESSDVEVSSTTITPSNKSKQQYGEVVYQESITNEIARALLQPKDFDPDCHYQLISFSEVTMVVKIDDRITEEFENENRRRITEYVLDSTNEVQSYSDMLTSMHNTHILNKAKLERQYTSTKRNIWGIITGLMFLILLGVGIGIFGYLLSL